jgi:hypothetical protein
LLRFGYDFREIVSLRSLVDVPITRKGDEATFITAMHTPVPGKKPMISTVWDVTERKHVEKAEVVEE